MNPSKQTQENGFNVRHEPSNNFNNCHYDSQFLNSKSIGHHLMKNLCSFDEISSNKGKIFFCCCFFLIIY